VVTAVELLSPANKSSDKDGEAYLTNRQEYFRSGVNLVEMDLLRSGNRPPTIERRPPADYYVLVSRAVDYPRVGLWSISVRDQLPPIPIPLYPEDAPVMLALRPSLDRAYDEGRLDEDINYTQPPDPPLDEPDASWARELLARHFA
jgi:hypothetical protein